MDEKKGIRIALIAFGICALLGIVDLVLDIVDKAWVNSMSSFAFDISKLVLWGALFFIYLGKYRGNKSRKGKWEQTYQTRWMRILRISSARMKPFP